MSNYDHLLWRIDPFSGLSVPVGHTVSIPPGDGVMDLAYDWESGTFIASVLPGVPEKFPFAPPPFGAIYRIDAQTGFSTLLNGNAPPMYGMAEAVPEPSTTLLLLPGIAIFILLRRRPDFLL